MSVDQSEVERTRGPYPESPRLALIDSARMTGSDKYCMRSKMNRALYNENRMDFEPINFEGEIRLQRCNKLEV